MPRLSDYPVFSPWNPDEPLTPPTSVDCLGFTFYLGTHKPSWLATVAVPLFVSRRQLVRRRTLPRALGRWALDSGAFTEIGQHGQWTVSAVQYAQEVRRFREEIGNLDFAAPQDWMCEPEIVAFTGLSVEEHQRRTLDNYLELRALAPDLPIIPVLQGWTLAEYDRHWEMYDAAGIDLTALPRVGIGSVCRRQNTMAIADVFSFLAAFGIRAHGFGVKKEGLRLAASYLASADSMAWSYAARSDAATGPRPATCAHRRACNNCLHYALEWRERLFDGTAQCELFPR